MEEQMHRHTSKGREVYSIIRVFNSGQFSSMYKYLRLIPESWFIFIFILFIIIRIIINVIISTTSQLAFARARSRPHYKACKAIIPFNGLRISKAEKSGMLLITRA